MSDYVKSETGVVSSFFPKWKVADIQKHNKERKRCEKCRYGCNCGALVACYYIMDVGHSRPCEGESATHKCECFDPRVELRANRTEQIVVSFRKYFNDHKGNI